MRTATEWGDRIPVGLIYRNDRPAFETHFPALAQGPLAQQDTDREALQGFVDGFR